jgi:hypothetical protein
MRRSSRLESLLTAASCWSEYRVKMNRSAALVRSHPARVIIGAAKAMGLLLLSVALLLLLVVWSCAAPSDKSLSKRFQRHRSALEALARMSQEDGSVRVVTNDGSTYGWTSSQPGAIPGKRLDEYRRLFRDIGAKRLDKDGEGDMYLEIHTGGFVTHGADKGLLYCVGPEEPKVHFSSYRYLPCEEQLQHGQEGQKGDGYDGCAYLRLAENWYIFEKWD